MESIYPEITAKIGTPIVPGSLHRAPNTRTTKLREHILETANKIKSERGDNELVLSMDHNLDLLNSIHHRPTNNFLETVLDLNLIPTIMRPTRITNTSATLIDNTFLSGQLQRNFDSAYTD